MKVIIEQILDEIKLGKSGVRVARERGIHYNTLRRHLKKAGIKLSEISYQSNFSIDESGFDEITEESAYWLGFLMADGCVYQVPEKSINRIIINLQVLDISHLEKFRKFLKSERTVHIAKDKKMASMSIGSRRLCEAVIKYGVIPRKCKVTKVIGLEMNRHFWRGVVDGDGCIVKSLRRVDLYGSEPLLRQYSDFIRYHFPEIKATVKKARHCHKVSAGVKVIGLLYNNCTIALDRKLTLAKSHLATSKI